jgi:hypothetical protein
MPCCSNKLMDISISKRGNVAKGEMSIRVYLLPEVKEKFKTACFLKGLNMSDITAALIEEWLVKNAVELPASQRSSTALTETDSPEQPEDPPAETKKPASAKAKQGKGSAKSS